jgi:hypothetical protein
MKKDIGALGFMLAGLSFSFAVEKFSWLLNRLKRVDSR